MNTYQFLLTIILSLLITFLVYTKVTPLSFVSAPAPESREVTYE